MSSAVSLNLSMTVSAQIAKHLREVYVGKNWTWSNLKEHLTDVDWHQAVAKPNNVNSIAALVYHINYFVLAAIGVLQGRPLTAHDKYSFDLQPIQNQQDWDTLVTKALSDAETLASLIETLPDTILCETFFDEKYGSYYRNLHGIIEHAHYHLGQIVIVKKMLQSAAENGD